MFLTNISCFESSIEISSCYWHSAKELKRTDRQWVRALLLTESTLNWISEFQDETMG